ncbi:MAG: DUF1318 domain-containing protein [Chthoniobacterales bacterium]
MKNKLSLLGVGSLILLTSCKTPSVNLTTNDPVKVNIDMRLDIYEHGSPTKQDVTKSTTTPKQRNRRADIMTMKISRIIGEGHDGLLAIRSEPAGGQAEYVHISIRDENAERMKQMKQEAEEEKLPLPDIQKKKAELLRNQALKGEEIEVPLENGTFKWIQKE